MMDLKYVDEYSLAKHYFDNEKWFKKLLGPCLIP